MTEKELSKKYGIKDFSILSDDILNLYCYYDPTEKEFNEEELTKIKDCINILKLVNTQIVSIRKINIGDNKKFDYSK